MNKSIVIIRSNPVKPDSRVEKEATALTEAGYKVKILAWDRDTNHGLISGKLESDERVQINRIGYKASYGEGTKNLIPYLKFQLKMMSYLYSNRNEIGAIHACDFDTAFFSSIISKLTKKTFIFDIFDFICGNPKNIIQKAVKRAQIQLINYADATIICTEGRKNQIKGSKPKKLFVIHNSPPSISTSYSNKKDNNDAVSIVYVGIFQDFRLLKEIINYFKKHPELSFEIAGFGKYDNDIREAASENSNIHYHGRIRYEDTLRLEQNADIMLAIYDPVIENHIFAAPNKFYEALMLGKPLIMVKGTGMSEEVLKNDIGVLIDYSEEGFDKGISQLIERQKEWNDMSERMKKLYENKYSWKEMSRRLIKLYSEVGTL